MFTNHTRNYTKFVKEIVINKFLRKTAVAAWTLDTGRQNCGGQQKTQCTGHTSFCHEYFTR